MQLHEFLGEVQNRAHLGSPQEALKASEATLGTLSERLTGGEPWDISSQLPSEIAATMRSGSSGSGERFSVDEFIERVSGIEGVDSETANGHAHAVLEVLCDAISPGEVEDMFAQLPEEYLSLFQPGSKTLHS